MRQRTATSRYSAPGAHPEGGFTLIELLVVILIIGILAAVAIPAFLSQRRKAQDGQAKDAVKTAQTTLESFHTENETYVTTIGALKAIEPSLPPQGYGPMQLSLNDEGIDTYRLGVASASGTAFYVRKVAGGSVVRFCTVPNSGGCGATLSSGPAAGNGRW